MAKRSELEPLIIQEWINWSRNKDKTTQQAQLFYAFLQREKPQLLSFRCSGDKWQVFKTILKDHLVLS